MQANPTAVFQIFVRCLLRKLLRDLYVPAVFGRCCGVFGICALPFLRSCMVAPVFDGSVTSQPCVRRMGKTLGPIIYASPRHL